MQQHTSGRRPDDEADASIELRAATEVDLRDALEPLSAAFGEDYSDEEFEGDRRLLDPARVIAARDGGRSVGCAAAFGFRLTVPGGEVAAAGVSFVGVSPSHRRRGILRRLMEHQLADVHERGEPVAILWASEGAIYQRFGYGLATLSATFEIERSQVRFRRAPGAVGRVRLVDAAEAERAFPAVHEAARVGIPGSIQRSTEWWRWATFRDLGPARAESGPKSLALCEVGGRPVGYAIFRRKAGWDDRGPRGTVLVTELVGTTIEAEASLWRWILDLDLVARIRAVRQPVPPILFHQLAEPRRLGLTVGDGIWLRLVDLPAALAARTYGMAGSLVLEVADDGCPWNAGRWRLESAGPEAGAAGPGGRVTRTRAAPDLSVDTTDLAAAYLGAVRFEELRLAGRVEERRPGAARTADRWFAAARAPSCSTIF